MKQEFHNIDNIEGFLNGSLKGKELDAFNQAIAQDPLLANEVNLQSNIQESLANTRKAELKARLSNITVTTIDPYRGVKIAASVIVGAIITGLLGFEMAKTTEHFVEETPSKHQKEEIVESTTTDETIPSEETVVFEETTEEKPVITTPEVVTTSKVETTSTEKPSRKETQPTRPTFPGVQDNFVPEDDSEPHLSTTEEIPNDGLNNNVDAKVAGDIVVHFESGRGDLQYKFEGPKVFLYGIDKSSTKPIFYDVFMAGNKKTYMKYQGNFYSLDRAITKKTNLLEEKDANIIKELKLRYKD